MDNSFYALVAFLVVAVLVAGVVLWPRFRESLASEDPVVPEVLGRLSDALRAADDPDPVYRDLLGALEEDPIAVRKGREAWRERLVSGGASAEILRDLDAL